MCPRNPTHHFITSALAHATLSDTSALAHATVSDGRHFITSALARATLSDKRHFKEAEGLTYQQQLCPVLESSYDGGH